MKNLYFLSVLALASCGCVHGAADTEMHAVPEAKMASDWVEQLRVMKEGLDAEDITLDRANEILEGKTVGSDYLAEETIRDLQGTASFGPEGEGKRLAQDILSRYEEIRSQEANQ